ncbi:MAG: phenylacetic acid degradation operon negative regulatory protein PaaX [Thiolinea sp.]
MPAPDTFSQLAKALIKAYISEPRSRANLLILTLYGDTICPYGGTVWLGSLIKLLKPLGINERLVRTSVYRLSEQNILSSQQQGRRSYYTLTARGLRQFNSAAKRIYAASPPAWDGKWHMVFTNLSDLDPQQRESLRRELEWLGFSRLREGLHVHPTIDSAAVQSMLEDRELQQHVALFDAAASGDQQAAISNQLMSRCFDTRSTDEQYEAFMATYQPLLEAAQNSAELQLEYCFLVRTLLIHQYRYILLSEPELPPELLPEQAITLRARQLVRQLYRLLTPQSDAYFLRTTESDNGSFSRPVEAYYQRFETI